MLHRFTGTAERKASLAATVTLNRVGRPEEITNTITFLASKASLAWALKTPVGPGRTTITVGRYT
jgi:hypothetical protein